MKFLKYALIVLFSVSMMSCSSSSGGDDIDNVSPEITIATPTEGQVFVGDEVVKLSFTAKDNVALESYDVNVKLTKLAVGVASLKITPDVFTFTKTDKLSGTSQVVNLDMELPGNPEKGEYTIKIIVADASSESVDAIEERIFIVE